MGKRAGSISKQGYRRIGINGKTYRAGRLAFLYMTGRWPNPEVDHENKVRDDDRWNNLRELTKLQNMQNRNRVSARKKQSTLPIGVTHNNKKFKALARHLGKRIYLGTFETSDEAHQVYLTFIGAIT